jgi:hypothetical protein
LGSDPCSAVELERGDCSAGSICSKALCRAARREPDTQMHVHQGRRSSRSWRFTGVLFDRVGRLSRSWTNLTDDAFLETAKNRAAMRCYSCFVMLEGGMFASYIDYGRPDANNSTNFWQRGHQVRWLAG